MSSVPVSSSAYSAAHPYWVLHEKFNIDFASPKGPNPPLDLASVEVRPSEMALVRFPTFLICGQFHKDDYGSNKFLHDEQVKSKLATAKTLGQVVASE